MTMTGAGSGDTPTLFCIGKRVQSSDKYLNSGIGRKQRHGVVAGFTLLSKSYIKVRWDGPRESAQLYHVDFIEAESVDAGKSKGRV